MAWRYIVQRALSGEFLQWDLPATREELRWDLSGPGSLRMTVAPDVGNLRDATGRLILEPWGSYLYAEQDGEIAWGGIVQRSGFSGPKWSIEAAGFSSYPAGIPFLGDLGSRVDADPADLYAEIWADVQGYPDGNLGVEVDGLKTPQRIGTTEEPYVLDWTSAKDAGEELTQLAQDGLFEYVEDHFWDGDTIRHRIRRAYPRFGRKRGDLAFIQGDNVVSLVEPEVDGENFANEVFAIGAGEGRAARHSRKPVRDGRLRRPIVYTDKGERSLDRLSRLARLELDRHRPDLVIESVTVYDHPNARIGSWRVGDDVLVQASLPWIGDVAIWHRITSWALVGPNTATLSLQPSNSFTYGG